MRCRDTGGAVASGRACKSFRSGCERQRTENGQPPRQSFVASQQVQATHQRRKQNLLVGVVRMPQPDILKPFFQARRQLHTKLRPPFQRHTLSSIGTMLLGLSTAGELTSLDTR